MRRAGIASYGGALLTLALAAPLAGASGLASHVDPFAGTRPGPDTFGGGHTFPGASVPFGMVQWSPDTTPADEGAGGYDYRNDHIKGFSLTHLSGAGCPLYGDFPFLPTTEPLETSPVASGSKLYGNLQPGFSHANEKARPGYYSVVLHPEHGEPIRTELTATTRTGMARFTFPSASNSSVLINAGGSAEPDDQASVEVNPASDEISGSASSGFFCHQRPRYKVYFAAVFDRPFTAYGTWQGDTLSEGSSSASAREEPAEDPPSTAETGAYATFDTTSDHLVLVRVGLSFVSVAGARANLAAEDPTAGFGSIAAQAEESWNRALGKIRVAGGSAGDVNTFYTVLYHALLAPRTFSDANGQYIGMDGKVHTARGRVHYADFSGWDIYRTEIQLLSILDPARASDMISSLLADAVQSGCLPRWPFANGQSMEMIGDPADPIIASASAFGASRFNPNTALAAMIKGATQECHSPNGEYLERQGLRAYEELGYVPFDLDTNVRNANSLEGNPEAVWASAATSLEYNIDDFAIAQFAARALHDSSAYQGFMNRSATWRRLFNPSSGLIEPRYASGSFVPGYNDLEGGGFSEGNAFQYTWLVPQDPAGLFRMMGGRAKASARLRGFLTVLNANEGATHTEHALLGNEPTLQTPWLYDWAQRPYYTQEAVRRGLALYDTSPDGYPGNDDLGTLSAWYVFGALGLYPEVPGVGLLAIGSPLFGSASIAMPGHGRLRIETTAYTFKKRRPPKGRRGHRGRPKTVKVTLSPAAAPYIRSASLDGRPYGRPWTTFCALAKGGTLSFQLGPSPNRRWGTSTAARPPSFGPNRQMPKNACTP
jgi:predicted alpha-1,2-mannosidase